MKWSYFVISYCSTQSQKRRTIQKKTRYPRFTLKYLVAACALGMGTSPFFIHHAMADAILYQANSSNAVAGTVGLSQTNLTATVLTNPTQLSPGGSNYNYIAVLFRPTQSTSYKFGQTSAPVDTVMIFYRDRFSTTSPGTGALVGNDDTPAATHQAVPGLAGVTILCGSSAGYCPQVTYSVVAGNVYTIFISTYSPGASLPLPQSFYSSGPGDFGSFNNLTPINTTQPYFLIYDLNFTVKPEFAGGILRIDQVNRTYTPNFLLSTLATNTLDQFNNNVTLSGIFSDSVVGQPGVLTLVNSLGIDGSVTLSGINTYTGGTTLGTGTTLFISSDSNLGATPATLTFNGGTLDTTAAITSARSITLNNAGGTIKSDAALALSGTISGTGGLTKEGTGTLTLSGSNTYTGNTTINTGALQIGSGGTTGSLVSDILNNTSLIFNRNNAYTYGGVISGEGSLTQAGTAASVTTLTGNNTYTGGTTISSGTLQLGDGGTSGSVAGNITNNATLAFNHSDAIAYGGQISGTGSVIQAGSGNLTLSGTNLYSGGTQVNAGTLSVAADSNLGAASGGLTLNGGTLATTAGMASARGVTLGAAGGTVDTAAALSLSGNITGTGSLTKTGAGTLILSGTNGYTGGTTVNEGTVAITTDANLGGAAGALTLNGGTLSNNAAITSSRVVTLGSNNGTVNSNADLALNGVIGGTGSLIKTGTGTLTLGNSNTYSGGTQVTSGTLAISTDANLGAAANGLTLNGGTLLTTAALTSSRALTLGNNGGTISDTSPLTLNGIIDGVGGLTKTGTGALTLTGENTYTGNTTITAGTLQLGNGGTTGSIVGDIINNSALTFNHSNLFTYGNAISGSGSFTQQGTGTVILNGNNTYSGGTTISAGTLQIGSGGTTGSVGGNIVNNAALVFDRSDALTYSGTISGSGSLTQAGDGTLSLASANTYTGATLINSGVLQTSVTNALANSSSVAVNNGASFDLNNFSQSINNLSGDGSITLGSATLTINDTLDTLLSGNISGNGNLFKSGAANLTLSGTNSYSGGTTINAGTMTIENGSALGSGSILNNATLGLDFTSDSILANQLLGNGTLEKIGSSIATLTGNGSSTGNVNVADGELSLSQNGTLNAANYTTQTGATTSIAASAQLTASGAFIQATGAILNVVVGANEPAITATTATLGGILNISGLSGPFAVASALVNAPITVIHTTNGISGDFSSVSFGGVTSPVDYLTLAGHLSVDTLDYSVGFGLSWLAAPADANGVFTLGTATDSFNVDEALADRTGPFTSGWNGMDLTKNGLGTLTLSATNTYTGITQINAGTLQAGINNAFAQSSLINMANGATLDLNGFNQSLNQLSGNGTINLGAGTLTLNGATSSNFAGNITGSGGLAVTGTGSLALSGDSDYSGGTALTTGTLTISSGTALGTGAVSNNSGVLDLNFANDSTLNNVLTGNGADSLNKTGAGTATLTGSGSSVGNIDVQNGALYLAQSGILNAASYTTETGASTSIGDTSQLAVTNGFTQASNSTLNVALGSTAVPVISANTADLAGALNISGFSSSIARASILANSAVTIIHTINGITGNFDAISFGGVTSPVDYLTLAGNVNGNNYVVGFGLTWLAGQTQGNGIFTLGTVADSFNVDEALANRTGPFTSGWNGMDLTKNGLGTLTLSAANTYTGITQINAGILQAGISNAFAPSSSVIVSNAGTLALNNFAQTANDLSGAGNISLGSAMLTVNSNNDTAFSGAVSGTGGLIKAGAGTFTLSGANDYSGGTQITDGELTITNGQALGSGLVTNNAVLNLDFSTGAATLANILSGGTVLKTGTDTLTLTGVNSAVGTLDIQAGTLALGQNGMFTSTDYTTGGGAATSLGGNSQLTVNNLFTQAANSTLNINVGSLVQPAITATNAVLGGTLNISGLSGIEPTLASMLTNTLVTLVHTTGGITGNFSNEDFGGVTSSVDYVTLAGNTTADGLDYKVGFGLTWNAGSNLGQGTFTLNAPTDTFNVDLSLATEGTSLTGWDGNSLIKDGAGTLILSADNTYTGNTTINAGKLQIGNGGNTGSVAGNIIDNASLVFNRSDSLSYSGVISGAGTVTQAGSGTTILSGNNTYTGATLINAGILQAGAENVLAQSAAIIINSGATLATNGFNQLIKNLSGIGTVALQDATLTITPTEDVTFDGNFTGTGNLIKQGTNTLTLTNNTSQLTNVTVSAGELKLAHTDELAIGGNYTTENGATTNLITPSTQLVVGGVFTQQAGSQLDITLSQSPDIRANSASLNGTLNLFGFDDNSATPVKASDITEGQLYTLIHTETGITGNFVNNPIAGTNLNYLLHEGFVTNGGLDYVLGFQLAWMSKDALDATGNFTLNPSTAFDVDVSLADQTGTFNDWDGKTLTKDGVGRLVLSADNTYTGGTILNAGTLSVSSDNNLGDTAGRFTLNGGTLETTQSMAMNRPVTVAGQGNIQVDDNTQLAMSSVLDGNGRLTKTGGGSLNFTGDGSNFTGNLQIESGLLSANGVLASTVDVESTGILGGTGTVGALNVEPGATVAPGNSIGTLNVNGNSTFASGSFYQVQINPQGDADLLHINGILTINGGTVNVLSAPGDYSSIERYTIVDTTGGIDGKFSGLNTDFAFLTPTLEYDLYNVYLQFKRNEVNFSDYAGSNNQRGVARSAQSLGAGNRLYDALAALPNDRGIIGNALDQISGEFYASLKTALIEDDHFVRDAANDRLRSAFDGIGAATQQVMIYDDNGNVKADKATTDRSAFWGRIYGAWGGQDGDDNAAEMKRRTGGVILGGDAPVGTWRIGGLAGIGWSSFDVDARHSEGNSNNYSLGVYAGTQKDNISVRSALIYHRNNISTTRSVNFPGYSDSLNADYSANGLQAFGEVGYSFHADQTVFEPFNNLTAISLRTGSFSENGAEAALQAGGQTTNVTFNTLGMRVANDVSIESIKITTSGTLGWRHAFGSVTPESTQNLVGGTDFTVTGTPIARNAAVVELGVDAAINAQTVLGISYQGQLASDSHENGIRATLNWKF